MPEENTSKIHGLPATLRGEPSHHGLPATLFSDKVIATRPAAAKEPSQIQQKEAVGFTPAEAPIGKSTPLAESYPAFHGSTTPLTAEQEQALRERLTKGGFTVLEDGEIIKSVLSAYEIEKNVLPPIDLPDNIPQPVVAIPSVLRNSYLQLNFPLTIGAFSSNLVEVRDYWLVASELRVKGNAELRHGDKTTIDHLYIAANSDLRISSYASGHLERPLFIKTATIEPDGKLSIKLFNTMGDIIAPPNILDTTTIYTDTGGGKISFNDTNTGELWQFNFKDTEDIPLAQALAGYHTSTELGTIPTPRLRASVETLQIDNALAMLEAEQAERDRTAEELKARENTILLDEQGRKRLPTPFEKRSKILYEVSKDLEMLKFLLTITTDPKDKTYINRRIENLTQDLDAATKERNFEASTLSAEDLQKAEEWDALQQQKQQNLLGIEIAFHYRHNILRPEKERILAKTPADFYRTADPRFRDAIETTLLVLSVEPTDITLAHMDTLLEVTGIDPSDALKRSLASIKDQITEDPDKYPHLKRIVNEPEANK